MKIINYTFLLITGFLFGVIIVFFSWILFIAYTDSHSKHLQTYVQSPYHPTQKLMINTQKIVGKINSPWSGFAQGGEEANSMLVGTEQLMSQLNPSYIRLDHIFDDDYYGIIASGDPCDPASYYWNKLDNTINNIINIGAKPFLSLGYMPKVVAETKISIPYSWDKWQCLVYQTINHYSGDLKINNVYYEVWNEPDLESFGYWKYYGDKNYLTLYQVSARAAIQAMGNQNILPFKFGGSGITALYRNWMYALIRSAETNNLPLDFLSWHRYDYDPEVFAQDITQINKWVDDMQMELGKKLKYEYIISEWGPDPGKTSVYSTSLSASHAVAVSRKMIDGLDLGFAFEIKDGPNQNNFGWGLLSHNNNGMKAKPRYYAFETMKNMFGNRVSLVGEGDNVYSWVVKNKNQINLIATNYNYQNTEKFPVIFKNLTHGEYLFTIHNGNNKSKTNLYNIGNKNNFIVGSLSLKPYDIAFIDLKLVSPLKRKKQNLKGFARFP